LYDFSANVGDSISINKCQHNYNKMKVLISEIDSIYINGFYRKEFIISTEKYCIDKWIEGIFVKEPNF